MVLGWFELPDDDRPPERIWMDDEALSEHFERVRGRYRSDSRGPEWEEIPGDLQQNALTTNLRR